MAGSCPVRVRYRSSKAAMLSAPLPSRVAPKTRIRSVRKWPWRHIPDDVVGPPLCSREEVTMALASETAVQHANDSAVVDSSHAEAEFPTPYLGRSVRIVGQVVNVDMNQSPHPKNARGEF